MTPKDKCIAVFVCIAVATAALYFTNGLESAAILAAGALAAAYLWIIRMMGEDWIDASEVDQIQNDKSRITARLDRYRLSLSALPEGVVLIRRGKFVEWCNAAASDHLGVQLALHMGVDINEVITDAKILDYLQKADFTKPIKAYSKEPGRELLISAVAADSTHFIIVTQDITELHRIENMRRDFVANVSHELRTPLTVLLGFLDMLVTAEHVDHAQLKAQLMLMQDEAARMKNLVNDLLMLASLENKDDQAIDTPEIISMTRLTEAVSDDARHLSKDRHTITTTIASDVAIWGFVDEIRSACTNLVSNAVRYTPEGGAIEVAWYFDPVADAAVYSVKDNGIGIAEKDIPRLTERFYRADKSRSRAKGGTGLGLAIVKHVALRNRAKLEIESKLGEGSVFRLVFPRNTLAD